MTTTALSTLDHGRTVTTPALREAVARLDPVCGLAASYHFGWCDEQGRPAEHKAGKAVRPAMVLLAAEAVGAAPETAVPGAVAVELVHNFSLVHDDLLDGDRERRHRPTVWAIWDAATAILAGDAMLALAHEVLLESPSPGAGPAAWMLAAATRELTRGQAYDLAFERRHDVTLAECFEMADAKTGSLLGASAGVGALLGGALPAAVDALSTFGRQCGLAFQLVDDVLGIWGDPAVTGKPALADLRARKKSLPIAAALAAGGPAADRLRTWLATPAPPPDHTVEDLAELRGIAELVDEAGGRAWAAAEARRQVVLAEQALAEAPVDPAAAAELVALARSLLGRSA
jgi:geranylgeranyl diphosphate synthase type I